MPCWECQSGGDLHNHHVVPKSKGGKRTIPLCESCHSKVHGHDLRISGLIRDAMAERAAKGLRVSGKAPYGYRHTEDDRREPVASEQALIKRALILHTAGYSQREIARVLREQGYLNRNGQPMSYQTVGRILRRWRKEHDHRTD